jgi:hypothetical protein
VPPLLGQDGRDCRRTKVYVTVLCTGQIAHHLGDVKSRAGGSEEHLVALWIVHTGG